MIACEKCWGDSGGNTQEYYSLIQSTECTPEEQAGGSSGYCPLCHRWTVHQHAKCCVSCGWRRDDPN